MGGEIEIYDAGAEIKQYEADKNVDWPNDHISDEMRHMPVDRAENGNDHSGDKTCQKAGQQTAAQ